MWRLSEHRNVSWRFSHRNGNNTKYVKILLQIVLKCLIWHSLYFNWNLLSLFLLLLLSVVVVVKQQLLLILVSVFVRTNTKNNFDYLSILHILLQLNCVPFIILKLLLTPTVSILCKLFNKDSKTSCIYRNNTKATLHNIIVDVHVHWYPRWSGFFFMAYFTKQHCILYARPVWFSCTFLSM